MNGKKKKMKAENFILINEAVKLNAALRIKDIVADGKIMVTIHNAGDRSVKQNALLWLWNTFISKSGAGSYDTKEAVHRSIKKRWVIPILLRDDPEFSELYAAWKNLHGCDVDKMNWFIDEVVSTTKLTTHQMAEMLTDYQRFYLEHEMPLPDPDDLKLLYYKRQHVSD